MPIDAAPWSLVFAPLFLVIGILVVLPPLLPMAKPWARLLIVGAVWAVTLRYLHWRLTETLVLDDGWQAAVWSCVCLTVEALAHWETAVLFLIFLRTTDRSAQADGHEARLRATEAAKLARVDVLIPTYNEPLEILEKTIVGALSMEWPNMAVYVLDDGRRAWLRDFCEAKGVGYITRPDNRGAKAGNINHALTLVDGEFVAIFDADFIPQRTFLIRMMGFFEDPKVGIVQAPHAFYNHDPMQTNLALRTTLPNDQRFFFESIMPSRDGWDAAFCCGSNSITRRAALRTVGDALPEGSITEDMLLTMVLLREGFVTRYLCERLAFGLAPESVSAFFIQRQRWAQGAVQTLFLRSGPFGPGLRLAHRLFFLPSQWLTHAAIALMSLIAPLVFLLTGLPPMAHTTLASTCFYLLPMLVVTFGGLAAFAPGKYNPIAAQVLGVFQSFKILPTVLVTLVRPHGHAFKVTPKGDAARVGYERPIFLACLALIFLTVVGVVINLVPEWRRVEDVALVPMVAFWCGFNVVVLILVSMLCLQMPVRRQEERFAVEEPLLIRHLRSGALATLMTEDMSISGVALRTPGADLGEWIVGDRVEAFVSGVGWSPAWVARVTSTLTALRFDHGGAIQRDLLIRKLFTGSQNTVTIGGASAWAVTASLLNRIWNADMEVRRRPAPAPAPETEPPEPELILTAATRLLPPSSERAGAIARALQEIPRAA